MTRRVVMPQPIQQVNGEWINDSDGICGIRFNGKWHDCLYGQTGDLLWVRETIAVSMKLGKPIYRADMPPEIIHGFAWRPSIHMPRWASRITLEITGVKVERVQDISEKDAKAEGVPLSNGSVTGQRYYEAWSKAGKCVSNLSAKVVFPTLWDSINAKRGYGFDVNPWVWAIEFRVKQICL
jgi:hypothetical protein